MRVRPQDLRGLKDLGGLIGIKTAKILHYILGHFSGLYVIRNKILVIMRIRELCMYKAAVEQYTASFPNPFQVI